MFLIEYRPTDLIPRTVSHTISIRLHIKYHPLMLYNVIHIYSVYSHYMFGIVVLKIIWLKVRGPGNHTMFS